MHKQVPERSNENGSRILARMNVWLRWL